MCNNGRVKSEWESSNAIPESWLAELLRFHLLGTNVERVIDKRSSTPAYTVRIDSCKEPWSFPSTPVKTLRPSSPLRYLHELRIVTLLFSLDDPLTWHLVATHRRFLSTPQHPIRQNAPGLCWGR